MLPKAHCKLLPIEERFSAMRAGWAEWAEWAEWAGWDSSSVCREVRVGVIGIGSIVAQPWQWLGRLATSAWDNAFSVLS